MAELFMAGDHVPEILLFDVAGKVKLPPEQIGATWVKVGFVNAFTVTLIVAVFAHCPAVGVKV